MTERRPGAWILEADGDVARLENLHAASTKQFYRHNGDADVKAFIAELQRLESRLQKLNRN